jgi:predicted DNA-binding protein with PD1-like motif
MLKAMKFAALNDHAYVLRLELGDDVHDTIQKFCAEHDIDNASVEGIGSFDSPTLAHYSIKTKQFTDKQLTGIFEVTSLLGNIALVDDQPFAHIHATVSGPDMVAYAGHLVKAACSATLEIIVFCYPSHHWKTQDDAIGLKVWDFESHRSQDIRP